KSTLCLLAMGLAPHFFGGRLRGSVVVFGRDSRSVKVAERSAEVGLLFQNPFTQVSGARERVDEEIAFGPECHGLPLAEVDERLEELCELCPRIVAMAGGRLLADGSPELVFNDEAVADVVGLPTYTRLARQAGLPKPWPVRLSEAVTAFKAPSA